MHLILAIMLLFPVTCMAMGKNPGPLVDSRIQLAEQMKLADKVTGLEQQFNGEVSGIRQLMAKLSAQVDAQGTAIGGWGNTVSKMTEEIKAGRDAYSHSGNTNEKEIFIAQLEAAKANGAVWEKLFFWLLKFVVAPLFAALAAQSGRLWWVTKRSIKESESARYYQLQFAAATNADSLDKIMSKKKEIEKERSITHRAANAVRNGICAIRKEDVMKKAVTMLLMGVLLLGGIGVVAHAEDGVSVDGDNLTITNVNFFGQVLNFTNPIKGVKVAYLLDLLHSSLHNTDLRTAIGAEFPLSNTQYRSIITNRDRIIALNVLIAAVVSGGNNKGLLGISLDWSSPNPDEDKFIRDWRAGPWIAGAGDGEGLYGGVKAEKRF